MKSNQMLVGLLFLTLSLPVCSQLYFTSDNDVKSLPEVRGDEKKIIPWPWTGGMNSCQFSEIDMNLDGIKDLFVFDRFGNRKIPFLNGGQAETVDYDYAPEFADAFPAFHDWVILKDYNMDDKPDIFTYSNDFPGIIVYRNISQDQLAFTLEVDSFLTSFQGGGHVNILTTDVDYPAIDDIDYDGDIDILTFWGLGSFVEYHQNQSMELYGVPDSLEFVEVTQCWGRFAENDESNVIYLDTCNSNKDKRVSLFPEKTRHTGSTFLLIDLGNDMDKDLILGDVDYPNPIQLINGGTAEEAFMISQDNEFPSYDKPVRLFSMPAGAYIDVNNNGINDLILSPFDPGLYTSENENSVWLYMNTGENTDPVFSFETKNFLQTDMIDVGSAAYPVFADYNGDGLMDLFIGNYGIYKWSSYTPNMFLESVYWANIALFKNSGTNLQPEFTLVTRNFTDLHSFHLTGTYPAFGDLDGDNDQDMLVGSENGKLLYFQNIAAAGDPMEFTLIDSNYMDIDVGAYSTPQLFRINDGELIDLVVGEENGNLNYYENTGNAEEPVFTFITDSLGGVDLRAPDITFSYTGYSTPCFFHGTDGNKYLLVGSEQGKVFYFSDIENNLTGEFTENDTLYKLIDEESMVINPGIRTGAAIYDLDADGFMEMIVGNFSGGLNFYKGIEGPPVAGMHELNHKDFQGILYPNPARDQLNFKCKDHFSDKDIHIEIFDVNGKMAITKSISNICSFSLDVSDLRNGLYFIRFSFTGVPDLSYHDKFIKW